MRTEALEVVRAYHRAWSERRFSEAAEYLAEQLEIEVPINSYPTKASFIAAVERTRDMVSRMHLMSELGGAEEAMLLYDLWFPFGVMRVAEHFTVRSGRITRIRQIHDTAAIREALAGAGASAP